MNEANPKIPKDGLRAKFMWRTCSCNIFYMMDFKSSNIDINKQKHQELGFMTWPANILYTHKHDFKLWLQLW